MTRWHKHDTTALLLCLLVTSGCSLTLDPDQYIREDDAGMDAGDGNGDAGVTEEECDVDQDTWFAERDECDVFAASEDEARDCDDDNPDVYPFAPAECGNGVVDNCQSVPEAWQELGIQELVSFFDHSEESADVTSARQLSVAPRRDGEPGAFISLMEEGRPILRTASVSDGTTLSLDSRADLADGTDAASIQSVAIQKLSGSSEALLAFVGRTSVAGTGLGEQSTLWYGRLTDGAPQTSSILVPAGECAGMRTAAPRLAIAGGSEPRMIWLQGPTQNADPRVFASYGPQDDFRCHEAPEADALQHIGSTTGQLVASVEPSNPDSPRFWDGSDIPPQQLQLGGVSARSDLIALPDNLNALFYANDAGIGAKLLQCTPGEEPLCSAPMDAPWSYELSGTRGALATGEALENGGAVTIHVERSGEGEEQFEDVLLDALGSEGELLTEGDGRWPYSLLFVSAPRTLVDLDVGATFTDEQGLFVYVAALTADQVDADRGDDLTAAGDELLLGGVRGCMEP